MYKMEILILSVFVLLENVLFCSTAPVDIAKKGIHKPRQLDIIRTDNGGYQASFSLAQAFKNPGTKGTIAASRVYNVGPQGSSSAGGQSANILGDSPGVLFDYSMSHSQAKAQNQFGTADANANAVANMFETPWMSSANNNANSHANVNRFSNPYDSPSGYF